MITTTPTSDETALLAAIRANPAEDSVRLAYADWLDENAEPMAHWQHRVTYPIWFTFA